MPDSPGDNKWHVDKTINLAMAVGFAGVAASGIWYAAISSARLDMLERQMAIYAPQAERVIRLETKMDGLVGALSEIKQMLRPHEGR